VFISPHNFCILSWMRTKPNIERSFNLIVLFKWVSMSESICNYLKSILKWFLKRLWLKPVVCVCVTPEINGKL